MLKTRIMVPFSEAVASSVPSLFTAIQESGELCAVTMFADSILFASYTKTSPVVGATWPDVGGACDGVWKLSGFACFMGTG